MERFDRTSEGHRRLMHSALTLLGLHDADGMAGRYGTYPDLATEVRSRFANPTATLRELFARITFNILVGNTDDHPRNHAAFWDGTALTLTPAYDICPQPRLSGEAAQAMAYSPDGDRLARSPAASPTHPPTGSTPPRPPPSWTTRSTPSATSGTPPATAPNSPTTNANDSGAASSSAAAHSARPASPSQPVRSWQVLSRSSWSRAVSLDSSPITSAYAVTISSARPAVTSQRARL